MTLPSLDAVGVARHRIIGLRSSATRLLLQSWFCILFLVTLGSVVRAPALQGPFLWDDNYLALTNPFIKSPLLIFETFRHYLFLDSYSVHYRPVQNISLVPDYYFWTDNPFGFHLSNILWHVAAGVTLFFLLKRLLTDLPRTKLSAEVNHLLAFLLALLWIVHPVHSAAIDYVSGRADSLAFFFACASWLTFRAGRDRSSVSARCFIYSGSFVLGLLALCSRESALMWLVLFLAYSLLLDEKMSWRAKTATVAVCLVLIGAYAGLRHLTGPRAQVITGPQWPPATRAVLMLRALGDYGRLMICPVNLHMERSVFDPALLRDPRSWEGHSAIEYLSLLGLGMLTILAFGAMRKDRGRELRIIGAAWFLIAYLPTSNLITLNATVAEHWLYLPSVGLLIFFAGCALALPRRSQPWVITLVAISVVGLSVRSYDRSCDWSSAERFFQQTVAAAGSSRAATNLALVYSRRGEYSKAERLLKRVLQLSPNDPIARNNMADVLRHLGHERAAEKILIATSDASERIRKDYPRTWVIAANLARLRHAQKNDKAAFAILDQARRDYPEVWELTSYEAELLRENEGPAAAQHLVENFARKNWWHHGAVLALGRIYAEKNNARAATEALTRASRLDVHDVEALDLIAQIRLRERRFDEAYRAQRRAIARQPDAPRQYALLSDILEKMGRSAEAKNALAQVKRLQDAARQNGSLLN